MSERVISVQNLSKRYTIGTTHAPYSTLRESVSTLLSRPFRGAGSLLLSKNRPRDAAHDECIWALKDVSFEIKRGEVIGIIGRNGAGKSTLLKVLSQITEPTEGQAVIYGRVGSLLEVGTGFHPELTGRENVYLNGAILGMKRAEIQGKFDEIVTFAEVERFIDTPVKHYSSGMAMRLAFAVAAHLEPEILLVDEVLAVGDAGFQKKCLGKMEGVAKQGRTVLFVSHNMVAVQTLCQRVIWLHDGKIAQDGQPAEVVSSYFRTSASMLAEQVWIDVARAPGNHKVRVRRISVCGPNPEQPQHITTETSFVIQVEFWNLNPNAVLHVTLHLYTEQQIMAFSTGSGRLASPEESCLPVGLFKSVCHVPGNLLNSGMYKVSLLIVENRSSVIYRQEEMATFEVLELGRRQFGWQGREPGVVKPDLRWSTELVESSHVSTLSEVQS